MTTSKGYTVRGEWGGFTVRRARTGWVVEQWSAVQGSETGGRYLVAYGLAERKCHVKRGDDLAASYGGETVGAYLAGRALNQGLYSRVLRRPTTVR